VATAILLIADYGSRLTLLTGVGMNVELIRVHTEDGIELEGILRQPASGVTSQLPIDAIIMHHGVGGNFYAVFDRSYQLAHQMVARGEADGLFAIDIPTPLVLTARTYLDKYGPEERYNILTHLPQVQVPLLVIIGSLEGTRPQHPDRFPFGGLAAQVPALAQSHPPLTFQLIPGADHHYTGVREALWSAVETWLTQ
jgi:hypothetical protein